MSETHAQDELIRRVMAAWNNVPYDTLPEGFGPANDWTKNAWLRVIAALQAVTPDLTGQEAVKVKPLVWRSVSTLQPDRAWRADSAVGRYTVVDGMGWGPEPTDTVWRCGDDKAAMRRCQVDFDSRIRAEAVLTTAELRSPIIHDNGRTNPLIELPKDVVLSWLRSLADAAGYADRELSAVQVKFHGTYPITDVPQSIAMMVSNIPNSRR